MNDGAVLIYLLLNRDLERREGNDDKNTLEQTQTLDISTKGIFFSS